MQLYISSPICVGLIGLSNLSGTKPWANSHIWGILCIFTDDGTVLVRNHCFCCCVFLFLQSLCWQDCLDFTYFIANAYAKLISKWMTSQKLHTGKEDGVKNPEKKNNKMRTYFIDGHKRLEFEEYMTFVKVFPYWLPHQQSKHQRQKWLF